MDNDAIVNEKDRTHPADINRLLNTSSKNYEFILNLYTNASNDDEKNSLKKLLIKSQGDISKINDRLTEDKIRATEWYIKKAKEGLPYAQIKLGYLYTFGENGLKADNEKAMFWFDKAARQGDAYGQYRLAMMYELYRLDKNSAFYWYYESAKQGNYFAKLAIENMNKKE